MPEDYEVLTEDAWHKRRYEDIGKNTVRYDVVVEGTGQFPVDMMRRDSSVPMTLRDWDESQMTMLVDGPEEMHKHRIVRLLSRFEPNWERWETFGWKVLTCRILGVKKERLWKNPLFEDRMRSNVKESLNRKQRSIAP